MADSANKDDVSNKVQTDDVASSETPDDATPDEQTASAEAQALAKQKQVDQLVKDMAELTAQAKISADVIITLRKESDSHALEAKLAREVSEDVFNDTYTGGP